MSEEAEALEAEAQDLYVEIRDASVVKDEFLAEHRANAKELNDARDAALGRAAAELQAHSIRVEPLRKSAGDQQSWSCGCLG